MNVIQEIEKHRGLINAITVITISIFLSIYTSSLFIVHAANTSLIIGLSILLIIAYIAILIQVKKIYLKSLIAVYQKIYHQPKLNNDVAPYIIWLPSGVLASVWSIVIFFITNKYMEIELSTLGDSVSYSSIITQINNLHFSLMILVFILVGVTMQVLYLIKTKSMTYFPAIISSICAAVITTIVMKVILVVLIQVISFF